MCRARRAFRFRNAVLYPRRFLRYWTDDVPTLPVITGGPPMSMKTWTQNWTRLLTFVVAAGCTAAAGCGSGDEGTGGTAGSSGTGGSGGATGSGGSGSGGTT